MEPQGETRAPERRFRDLAERALGGPGITAGTGFGSAPGLRVDGRIFAMLVRDELVVKLPKARVAALVEAGDGARFDPGHGRRMTEWIAVPVKYADWEGLVRDALAFVGRRP